MKDELGDRMKSFYEDRYRIYLTRRTPVIIRLDGNAFHTFTRGLDKPFDKDFMLIMQKTCKYLCENIQGCVGGYVQSDEISLLLIDYENLNSDAWFDYNLQKIVSIAAAKATLAFNKYVDFVAYTDDSFRCWEHRMDKATFDARAFNLPKEEVCNYFIWRQKDATRNSINAVGQSIFSHKELLNKSLSDVQDMLFQKGINWNDYSVPEKRGSFVRRTSSEAEKGWVIDKNMPILTENRAYIEDLI